MDTKQLRRRVPSVKFRVLIIGRANAGRANAGKTFILQRICDTTESPIVWKSTKDGYQSEVRGQPFCLRVRSHRRTGH